MRPSKREKLIQNALLVFYRDGFHATGMDKIAEEVGVSKTSIYNHFRSKEDLILAVLRLRDENFRRWLYRRIEQLATDPRDQLIVLFDVLDEWFCTPEFKGCLFIKASSEYQNSEHAIHRQSADHKRLLFRHFATLAKAADLDKPEQLASQLMMLKDGAIVTAHLGYTKTPATDAKQIAIAVIAMATRH